MNEPEKLRSLVSTSTNFLHSLAAPHEFASSPRRFFARDLRDLLLALIEQDGPQGWENQLQELLLEHAADIEQADKERDALETGAYL